jgi:hypothetical protein
MDDATGFLYLCGYILYNLMKWFSEISVVISAG